MKEQNTQLPKKAFFELTRACNLTCTHCLNNSGSKLINEMSQEEILETIRKLAAIDIIEIRFTGGEPMVHPSLESAIMLTHQLGIRASIGTNGVAITASIAERFSDAGLNLAIVSIDGDRKTHDQIRGNGSFVRAWKGIRALRSSNVEVRVNAVAMRTTRNTFFSLAEACEQEGVKLFVRRFIPSGRARGNLSEFLTQAEYEEMRQKLEPWIKRGIVDGHYLGTTCEVCSAGTSGFVILSDGNIKSCGFLSELGEVSYGNVRRDSLHSIWNRICESHFHIQGRSELLRFNIKYPHLPVTNCMAIVIGATRDLVQLRRIP